MNSFFEQNYTHYTCTVFRQIVPNNCDEVERHLTDALARLQVGVSVHVCVGVGDGTDCGTYH